jgi:prepilin-type processing-associated H-X9-DG protein
MGPRAAAVLVIACAMSASGQVSTKWPQHSMDRPQPLVVDPGPFTASAPPPSDAIVLFDGRSLSGWRSADSAGSPARWNVSGGYMEVVAKTGAIQTTQAFGDVQLHVEWRTPTPPSGESQERGNSGVFLMGRYEVQVLDSYHNVTYADGHAGAIYGQFPPLVNPSRPPGEWQTYDIVFHRPRFDPAGTLLAPARMTVFMNGILVQDDVALSGPTANQRRPPYVRHADALPIQLQDHGNPVRFRNIWARRLE